MSEKPRIPVDFEAWGYLPGSAYEKWMLNENHDAGFVKDIPVN
jgi:hypothetical protein